MLLAVIAQMAPPTRFPVALHQPSKPAPPTDGLAVQSRLNEMPIEAQKCINAVAAGPTVREGLTQCRTSIAALRAPLPPHHSQRWGVLSVESSKFGDESTSPARCVSLPLTTAC